MIGSLQRKHGVWYAVLNVYADGKRRQKWISTGFSAKGNKRKAQEVLSRLLVEYDNHTARAVAAPWESPYLHKYLHIWLENKRDQVEMSTWEAYEIYMRVHLAPWFQKQGLRIGQVSTRHIKQYLDEKARVGRADGKKGGLSIDSLKKHKAVLHMVFRDAVLDELADRNPAASVPLPRRIETESKTVFLNIQQANQMLAAFRGHVLQPLVYLSLYYGLRRSEVLGLKWQAVDFEKNTLRIQHTVVKNKSIIAKDRTEGRSGDGTPYALLPEVRELLLQIRDQQEENRRILGRAWQSTNYIFVHPDGSSYRPDCVTRSFQRVLKRNGLPHMRFHDLRHSCASILHDKGWASGTFSTGCATPTLRPPPIFTPISQMSARPGWRGIWRAPSSGKNRHIEFSALSRAGTARNGCPRFSVLRYAGFVHIEIWIF